MQFLSTPSARRATGAVQGRDLRSDDFYPRPPRGGRPTSQKNCRAVSLFLSTPSARRATRRVKGQRPLSGISIHALREEGDPTAYCRCCFCRHFYPRPPRGGRQGAVALSMIPTVFLSTPSARRATAAVLPSQIASCISIHALREEGDPAAPCRNLCIGISIHALREEGDHRMA